MISMTLTPVKPFVWLFIGGGLGSLGRYFLTLVMANAFGTSLPWGTLTANILGCLLIGMVYAWFAHIMTVDASLRLFLITGCLGGFTTFSAFGLETWMMIDEGAYAAAAMYSLGSVAIGLLAVMSGIWLFRNVLT